MPLGVPIHTELAVRNAWGSSLLRQKVWRGRGGSGDSGGIGGYSEDIGRLADIGGIGDLWTQRNSTKTRMTPQTSLVRAQLSEGLRRGGNLFPPKTLDLGSTLMSIISASRLSVRSNGLTQVNTIERIIK